jgi:O-antigen/teichoic acid export membrane protein
VGAGNRVFAHRPDPLMKQVLSKTVRAVRESNLVAGGGVLLFGAITIVNASNFLFHVLISRILGPSSYGALGALLGALIVLQVPIGAMQVAITQAVAVRRESGADLPAPLLIGRLVSKAVIVGLAAALVMALLSPWLRSFLHLPSAISVVLLGAALVPMLVGLVPKAVMLGELRFRPVAYALIAGAAVRVTSGVLLAHLGKGVTGAIGATVLGELTVAVALLFPLRHLIEAGTDEESLRINVRSATNATLCFAGYWVFLSMDTFLARHFLSTVESGLYAAASATSAAVLFLPGAIAVLAFPRFAAGRGRSPEARDTLMHALVAATVIDAVFAGLMCAFPTLFVTTLFGDQYRAASEIVGILAIESALMGVVGVLLHYLLAGESRRSLLVWVAPIGAAVGIARYHGSLTAIATTMLVLSIVVTTILMLVVLFQRRPPARRLPEGPQQLWDLTVPTVELTVVVPYYNPGERFRPNIERLVETLEAEQISFEVIAVSDGSTDGSERVLEGWRPDVVRMLSHERNAGKGAALRTGLSMASGRYVGFIDADGDIDPVIMRSFLAIVHEHEPDIVLGSKRHPESEVVYPPVRRLYSFGYQQLNRLLFRLNVRDTQTGVKLVRREVLADVLPLMIEKRFAFDLELFVVARHLGYSRFYEVPVHLRERFTSTISLKAVKGMLLDTLGIYYRLHITRFYDTQPDDGLARPAGPLPRPAPARENGSENGSTPDSASSLGERKLHL